MSSEEREEGCSREPPGKSTETVFITPEKSQALPEGRVLPLNSKRITAVLLRAIAQKLCLSCKGSLADLRLTIEGKLREEGKDTTSVQAIVQETRVLLIDEEGVFLEAVAGPESDEVDHSGSRGKAQEQSQQNEELQTALEEAQRRISELMLEVEDLATTLQEREKAGDTEVEDLRLLLKQEKEKGKAGGRSGGAPYCQRPTDRRAQTPSDSRSCICPRDRF